MQMYAPAWRVSLSHVKFMSDSRCSYQPRLRKGEERGIDSAVSRVLQYGELRQEVICNDVSSTDFQFKPVSLKSFFHAQKK